MATPFRASRRSGHTLRSATASRDERGTAVHMRLVPEDDYMHDVEDATNFNESAYYNFYDSGPGLGGWMRLGNRVNEGYAEMTQCLYLPDGRVAFWFARPHIEHNEAFDAGGLRFDIVTPFEQHRVTYEGPVVMLTEPAQMEDPRAAFANNPRVDSHVDLVHRGVANPWGGEPVPDEGEEVRERDPEKEFARGHLEQHMGVTGTVTVGDETFTVEEGYGLRDHSWGPRYWQNIWWYRWLTANLGPDLGFAFTYAGDENGRERAHGFLYDGPEGEWVGIDDATIDTDYDDRYYTKKVRATITANGREYEVEGDVWSLIPLRNRRGDMMTRITEGMTRWRCDDKEGAGLSEYLDQIIDGKPVGVAG